MIKKHVIIIRNAYSFDFGGGERFPVLLASELTNLGYKTTIISKSPKLLELAKNHTVESIHGWWWSKQNWNGKNLLLFPIYLLWQVILSFYYLAIFINKSPDIIHIQSKDDFISATIAGRLLNKKIIWTDHADLKHIWKNHNIWYKNPLGKLVYFAAHFASIITVVSNSELKLISNNLKATNPILKKINVIYNGAFDSYKKTEKNNKFTFISTGRLVTDKGIGELITAYNKFSKINPNTELYILSDGPERDKFEKMAKDNESITFFGHQNNPFEYINRSHVFILPTYHEGFSVALVEACMLNMPIITTNIGGNPEIITDHETGVLIPTKNSDALYDAMKLLFDDENLRKKLGDNARKQYLEKFQFDQIVKNEFIPLYKGVKK